eukprot:COSAG05_NODE_2139_length_3490_cov_9.342714_2_plen_127_part_00
MSSSCSNHKTNIVQPPGNSRVIRKTVQPCMDSARTVQDHDCTVGMLACSHARSEGVMKLQSRYRTSARRRAGPRVALAALAQLSSIKYSSYRAAAPQRSASALRQRGPARLSGRCANCLSLLRAHR